jgi:hypothetical protein
MTLETERSKYHMYSGVFSQIRGWSECHFCHKRKEGSYQDNENHCVICHSCMDGSTHSTSMIRVKVEILRHQFDDDNPITWTTGTDVNTSTYKTYQVPDERFIKVWIENKYSQPLELKFVYFEDDRDNEDYGDTKMFYTRKPQVLYTLQQDNTSANFVWKIYHEKKMIIQLNFIEVKEHGENAPDKQVKTLLQELQCI